MVTSFGCASVGSRGNQKVFLQGYTCTHEPREEEQEKQGQHYTTYKTIGLCSKQYTVNQTNPNMTFSHCFIRNHCINDKYQASWNN